MESNEKASFEDLFDTVAAHNKAARVDLMIARGNKAGEKSGYWIEVLGKDSDEARKFQRKQYDAWRQKAMTLRKMGRTLDMDCAEVVEEKAIEVVVNLTVGWSPNLGEFSKDAAKALYTKYPDIFRQMDEASGAAANF